MPDTAAGDFILGFDSGLAIVHVSGVWAPWLPCGKGCISGHGKGGSTGTSPTGDRLTSFVMLSEWLPGAGAECMGLDDRGRELCYFGIMPPRESGRCVPYQTI